MDFRLFLLNCLLHKTRLLLLVELIDLVVVFLKHFYAVGLLQLLDSYGLLCFFIKIQVISHDALVHFPEFLFHILLLFLLVEVLLEVLFGLQHLLVLKQIFSAQCFDIFGCELQP